MNIRRAVPFVRSRCLLAAAGLAVPAAGVLAQSGPPVRSPEGDASRPSIFDQRQRNRSQAGLGTLATFRETLAEFIAVQDAFGAAAGKSGAGFDQAVSLTANQWISFPPPPGIDDNIFPFPEPPTFVYYRFLDTELNTLAFVEGEDNFNVIEVRDDEGMLEDTDGIADTFPPGDLEFGPILDIIPPPDPNETLDPVDDANLLAAYNSKGLGNPAAPLSPVWGNSRPEFADADGEAVFNLAKFLYGGLIPFEESFTGEQEVNPGDPLEDIYLRAIVAVERVANVVFIERSEGDGIFAQYPFNPIGDPFIAQSDDGQAPLISPGDSSGLSSVFAEPADDYPWVLLAATPSADDARFVVSNRSTGAGTGRFPVDIDYLRDDIDGDGFPDVLTGTEFQFGNVSTQNPLLTGSTPVDFELGDVTNDGIDDLVVANATRGVLILPGLTDMDGAASGTFAPPPDEVGTPQEPLGATDSINVVLPVQLNASSPFGDPAGAFPPPRPDDDPDLVAIDTAGNRVVSLMFGQQEALDPIDPMEALPAVVGTPNQGPIGGGGPGLITFGPGNPLAGGVTEGGFPGSPIPPGAGLPGGLGGDFEYTAGINTPVDAVASNLRSAGSNPDLAVVNQATGDVRFIFNDEFGTPLFTPGEDETLMMMNQLLDGPVAPFGDVAFPVSDVTFPLNPPTGGVPVQLETIAAGDLNGDGRNDVIVSDSANDQVYGIFNPLFGGGPFAGTPGDFANAAQEVLVFEDTNGAAPGVIDDPATTGTITFRTQAAFDQSPIPAGGGATQILPANISPDGLPDFIVLNSTSGLTQIFLSSDINIGTNRPVYQEPLELLPPIRDGTQLAQPVDAVIASLDTEDFVPDIAIAYGGNGNPAASGVALFRGVPGQTGFEFETAFALTNSAPPIAVEAIPDPSQFTPRLLALSNPTFATEFYDNTIGGFQSVGNPTTLTLSTIEGQGATAESSLGPIPGSPFQGVSIPTAFAFNPFVTPAGDRYLDTDGDGLVDSADFDLDGQPDDRDGDGDADLGPLLPNFFTVDSGVDPFDFGNFGYAEPVPVQLVEVPRPDQDLGDTGAFTGSEVFGLALRNLLSTLNFIFEHTRPDRDDFITVNEQNIITLAREDFIRQAGVDLETQPSTEYDFESVMHFGPFAFSNGSGPVLEVNPEFQSFSDAIGQLIDLSELDKDLLIEVFGESFNESDDDNPTDWFLGRNLLCPLDVNLDGIQSPADLIAFLDLWEAQNESADIFPDFDGNILTFEINRGDGALDQNDVNLFFQILTQTGYGPCNVTGAGFPNDAQNREQFIRSLITGG